MSNAAWCDLGSKVDILKIHDMCLNPECKSQKQISFGPAQFQLQGAEFKN